MRLPARWATAALLLIAPLIGAPATASADSGPEGVQVEQSARAVPGQYIVTLEPELSPDTVLRELGLSPLFRYGAALHGFAASLTAAELEAVRTVPGVLAVEENAEVSVDAPRSGGLFRAPAAGWGTDRVDQRELPLDDTFTTTATGKGVRAYVVDTGIDTAHTEFGGRAVKGTTRSATAVTAWTATATARTWPARSAARRPAWPGGVAGRRTGPGLRGPGHLGRHPRRVRLGRQGRRAHRGARRAQRLARRGPFVLRRRRGRGRRRRGRAARRGRGERRPGRLRRLPGRRGRRGRGRASDRQDRETSFSNWGSCVALYAPGADIAPRGSAAAPSRWTAPPWRARTSRASPRCTSRRTPRPPRGRRPLADGHGHPERALRPRPGLARPAAVHRRPLTAPAGRPARARGAGTRGGIRSPGPAPGLRPRPGGTPLGPRPPAGTARIAGRASLRHSGHMDDLNALAEEHLAAARASAHGRSAHLLLQQPPLAADGHRPHRGDRARRAQRAARRLAAGPARQRPPHRGLRRRRPAGRDPAPDPAGTARAAGARDAAVLLTAIND